MVVYTTISSKKLLLDSLRPEAVPKLGAERPERPERPRGTVTLTTFLRHNLTVAARVVDTNRVPRIARVVAVGAPHHVTQRGNNRQKVFFSAADRGIYLSLLGSHCPSLEAHAARLLLDAESRPSGGRAPTGAVAGQGGWTDELRVCGLPQRSAATQRACLAKRFLFNEFEPRSPGCGAALCRSQPGSRPPCR